MVRLVWSFIALTLIVGSATAQDYIGGGSFGSSEPLFEYDDPEPWKHGYMQEMPFYGGYHSGRPYNYHHVFSQTQVSVGWGLPHGMPYSQQWWHRYEAMADPGRAMTEPNGYLGQNQAQPQWTVSQPQFVQQQQFPTQPQFVGGHSLPQQPAIAPVQYEQPTLPIIAPAGVAPQEAAQQSQQMRQYLNGPSLK